MFGWISRCWGGFGVNSQFQRARIRSVITDWKVPDDADLCRQNPEINPEMAIEMFLKNMEIDQQKNNPIFLLKHLYILDQTIQQRTALDKIGPYYNSQFFSFKTGSNIEINPTRQLIAAYFLYIKKKAQIYSQIDSSLFNKKDDRKVIIQASSNNDIYGLIDKCFEIQKLINQINQKYKGRNKTVELIQVVFTMLLKTYLFCYTIVSTSARILFKKLNKLTKPQTCRMLQFILYFNKDYTKNFVDFIESNKQISIYRNIKYSELILINKTYIEYLRNHIKNLQNQPLSDFVEEAINVEEEDRIRYLPQDILQKLSEDMRIAYQPRNVYRLTKNQNEEEFYNFENLYCDDYESEYETSIRNNYNLEQDKNSGVKIGTESKIFKSRKIEYESTDSSNKFSQLMWNQWKNVYSDKNQGP